MGRTILEMENISKSFGATQALSGIGFSLEEGEIHALLGENGAGKSTLIKILGGIYQPDTGMIRIDGKEVKMAGVQEAQETGIGIIHQEIVLVPYLSVSENIFLGRELKTKLGTKDMKAMNRQAKEMTERLGLYVDVTMPVGKLSIAQQQMVEIIKAISFHIKILVMDEPTSSLSDEEVELRWHLQRGVVAIPKSVHRQRMQENFNIGDFMLTPEDMAAIASMNMGYDMILDLHAPEEVQRLYGIECPA